MPLRQLKAYIEGLPHVQAIASFRAAEATALGTGSMKESGRRETIGRWKADVRRGPTKPRTPAEIAAAARAAGIAFVRTPKAKA